MRGQREDKIIVMGIIEPPKTKVVEFLLHPPALPKSAVTSSVHRRYFG